MKKLGIISYTENGRNLANKLIDAFGEDFAQCIKDDEIEALWNETEAFIFVCAAGIAVRKIAPFVKDKMSDPAVLVVDELGMNVIPILSGHVGGANELARKIEAELGINAVITTATDINGVLSIDEWAVKNGLKIKDKAGIKKTAMKLLKGEKVNLAFSDDVIISSNKDDEKECDLWLFAKPSLVAGIGCRKDKEFKAVEELLNECLKETGYDSSNLSAIASIDVKRDEKALIELSKKYDIPFFTFSADELSKVKGDFEESDFVEKTVGVSDVSARAAKLCGKAGEFALKKKKKDGMTISLFKQYKKVTIWYEED